MQREAGFSLSSVVPAQRSWGYPVVRSALEGAGLSEGHHTRFSAEQVEGSWGDPSSKAFVRIKCVVSEVTCLLLPRSGRGWWRGEVWGPHVQELGSTTDPDPLSAPRRLLAHTWGPGALRTRSQSQCLPTCSSSCGFHSGPRGMKFLRTNSNFSSQGNCRFAITASPACQVSQLAGVLR